jgi:hypothetical protein
VIKTTFRAPASSLPVEIRVAIVERTGPVGNADRTKQEVRVMMVHPSWVMFNPQPDPPANSYLRGSLLLPPGSLVALNPQPLPPGPANAPLQSGIIVVGG